MSYGGAVRRRLSRLACQGTSAHAYIDRMQPQNLGSGASDRKRRPTNSTALAGMANTTGGGRTAPLMRTSLRNYRSDTVWLCGGSGVA